jgi:ribosomal protein L21E
MYRKASMLIASMICSFGLLAQEPNAPKERSATPQADRAAPDADADMTYGRIKEFTAGQKIVIDVDNAIDKTFDLTDKDKAITVENELKVGDPVMVTERDRDGKDAVHITKHTGGGVQHGDRTTPTDKAQADRSAAPLATDRAAPDADADVTYGRIKEFTAGQKIVIDVDNAIDKTFDLTDKDKAVTVENELKVGDPVMVTERERDGKDAVHIAKHEGGSVQHGDRTTPTDKGQADRK